MENFILIKGKTILGENSENKCLIKNGDYINLDHLVTSDISVGEEFIREHCPLKIDLISADSIHVVDHAGNKLEIFKETPFNFEFRENNFTLTYL